MKYFILILFLFKSVNSISQIEYSYFDKSVVAIEGKTFPIDNELDTIIPYYETLGSGFLLGGSPQLVSNGFLVTCKHVIEDVYENQNGILNIRLNVFDTVNNVLSCRLTFDINNLMGKRVFYSEEPYDVAIVNLGFPELDSEPKDVLKNVSTIGCVPLSLLKNNNYPVYPSQFIKMVGFPDGLKGKYRNYPIYRFGIIANIIEDEFHNVKGYHYLADIISKPSDSGSIVFIEKNPFSFKSEPLIIGIHSGSFYEGLTVIQPIEIALLLVNKYLSKNE